LFRSRGEELERAHVTVGGLAGDRGHVLVDGDGRVLRGRDAPALAGLVAALEGDRLVVRDADGLRLEAEGLAAATGVPGAGTARADDHGAAPGGSAVAPVHLVSVGAEAGPGAEGCDPDPRANVVLDLGAGTDPGAGPETWTGEGEGRPGPGAERGWVGAVLAVGGARLVVTRTPKRCLGVYADVLVAGEVAVGDVVRRLEGGAPTTA
ncbi:MOSC N-terminal beta barrel domain-containing protein, partial [Pseudokineococcus marinus]